LEFEILVPQNESVPVARLLTNQIYSIKSGHGTEIAEKRKHP
jgi:hypothetical protein